MLLSCWFPGLHTARLLIQTQLPRVKMAHLKLGLPKSIRNRENVTQTASHINYIEVIFHLRFLFSRCVNLTMKFSHHTILKAQFPSVPVSISQAALLSFTQLFLPTLPTFYCLEKMYPRPMSISVLTFCQHYFLLIMLKTEPTLCIHCATIYPYNHTLRCKNTFDLQTFKYH